MPRRRVVHTAVGVALAVLVAAIGIDIWMRRLSTTVCRKDVTDILTLESAAERYAQLQGGAYPDSLAELVHPDVFGETFWRGTTLPLDPWGRAYRYEKPNSEFAFPRIWAFGEDGLPGGLADDADLGNWMLR